MAIPEMAPVAPALDDPDFYLGDPHAAFRWMRERAPVYRCERARLWAISKHADIMSLPHCCGAKRASRGDERNAPRP